MEINGKEVDYSKIRRWTLGDLEDLQDKGIDLQQMNEDEGLSFKQAIDLVHHFGHKVNKDVGRDDVRQLDPYEELGQHVNAIIERINKGQDEANPSSSTSSTSSDESTDGQEETA